MVLNTPNPDPEKKTGFKNPGTKNPGAQNPGTKRIVWLASYPKSGNTWLRLFLENLLQNKSAPFDINQPRDFTGMGDMTPFLFEKSAENIAGKPLEQLSDAEHVALRQPAHAMLSGMTRTVVFAKTHTANIRKFGMPLFDPGVTRQAVYVVRNPLDVVDSLSDHWGLSHDDTITGMSNPEQYASNPVGSGANNASVMKSYLASWSGNVISWTQKPAFPVLVLRYEDMLADPVKQFTRVTDFLRAPFSAQQIERATRFSAFQEIRKQEDRAGFAELSDNSAGKKFFRHGKADRWREVLTRAQAKRVIRDHKQVMQALGYDTKRGYDTKKGGNPKPQKQGKNG